MNILFTNWELTPNLINGFDRVIVLNERIKKLDDGFVNSGYDLRVLLSSIVY